MSEENYKDRMSGGSSLVGNLTGSEYLKREIVDCRKEKGWEAYRESVIQKYKNLRRGDFYTGLVCGVGTLGMAGGLVYLATREINEAPAMIAFGLAMMLGAIGVGSSINRINESTKDIIELKKLNLDDLEAEDE